MQPRVRTRASFESELPLTNLAELVMRGELPEPVAARVQSIADSKNPELMSPIFYALVRLRIAGVPHEEIARRFRVSVRSVDCWWQRAKPWLQERIVNLDPAETYSIQMEEFSQRRERLVAMMMGTEDVAETLRLSGALDRLSSTRLRWMDAHGYFDTVRFAELASQETDRSTREATELRKLFDVFRDDFDDERDDFLEQLEPYPDDDPGG
jgi:hypothetical protein